MKRAIVLVDHGSRFAQANQTLTQVAELVRAQLDETWLVQTAHMELEAPTIAQACAACVNAGAGEVVVHPYFLTPGRHATVDVARMVGEVAALYPNVAFRVTEPLGVDPLLAKLVLLRCGLPEAGNG